MLFVLTYWQAQQFRLEAKPEDILPALREYARQAGGLPPAGPRIARVLEKLETAVAKPGEQAEFSPAELGIIQSALDADGQLAADPAQEPLTVGDPCDYAVTPASTTPLYSQYS